MHCIYGPPDFTTADDFRVVIMNILIISIAIVLGAYLAFSPRLSKSQTWLATATPLASIMGSGFLVSAPLLAGVVGNLGRALASRDHRRHPIEHEDPAQRKLRHRRSRGNQ